MLSFKEFILESNVEKLGRTKLIMLRVRKGKAQRRKKFSIVKGWTNRGGHMSRISPDEHRHRQVGARMAKFKRLAKLQRSLTKRYQSLNKRKALGL
jgi:hypothetical protein